MNARIWTMVVVLGLGSLMAVEAGGTQARAQKRGSGGQGTCDQTMQRQQKRDGSCAAATATQTRDRTQTRTSCATATTTRDRLRDGSCQTK